MCPLFHCGLWISAFLDLHFVGCYFFSCSCYLPPTLVSICCILFYVLHIFGVYIVRFISCFLTRESGGEGESDYIRSTPAWHFSCCYVIFEMMCSFS